MTKIYSHQKIINNEWRALLFLCGGIGFGAFQFQNKHIMAANDKGDGKGISLTEYQYMVTEYIKNEKFDELIEFLWNELTKISNLGRRNGEIIDFLESRLCGVLCKMGKSSDALKIVEQYSDDQLIENQSLLRVAFVYHSAQKFEKAISLYLLCSKYMKQQLQNKIKPKDIPLVEQELNFVIQMHLAQCFIGLNKTDKAKEIYSDLSIQDIIKYGADKQILEFYQVYGTKDEAAGFKEFLQEHGV